MDCRGGAFVKIFVESLWRTVKRVDLYFLSSIDLSGETENQVPRSINSAAPWAG